MNDIADYGDMELWCLQRARDEPENAWKWQGQAQRSTDDGWADGNGATSRNGQTANAAVLALIAEWK